MFPGSPAASQIVGGSRTTSGLLATVPAGMTLTANIGMTAAVAVLGTSTPTVTVNGANASPATGTVIARLSVSGLLAAASSAAEDFEVLVKAPPGNDVTLDFTAGGVGTSSATISGWHFS